MRSDRRCDRLWTPRAAWRDGTLAQSSRSKATVYVRVCERSFILNPNTAIVHAPSLCCKWWLEGSNSNASCVEAIKTMAQVNAVMAWTHLSASLARLGALRGDRGNCHWGNVILTYSVIFTHSVRMPTIDIYCPRGYCCWAAGG